MFKTIKRFFIRVIRVIRGRNSTGGASRTPPASSLQPPASDRVTELERKVVRLARERDLFETNWRRVAEDYKCVARELAAARALAKHPLDGRRLQLFTLAEARQVQAALVAHGAPLVRQTCGFTLTIDGRPLAVALAAPEPGTIGQFLNLIMPDVRPADDCGSASSKDGPASFSREVT